MMGPHYTEIVRYSPLVMGWRWVYFHVCEAVALCALAVNFLPHERRFSGRSLIVYRFLVHYLAFVALNWRHCLPSLDLEFLGFLKIRHYREERGAAVDAARAGSVANEFTGSGLKR